MIEWKDVTSYRQGERGGVEPRTWGMTQCGVCICVTRMIHIEGWWGVCHQVGLDNVPLGTIDLAAAQERMIEVLSVRVGELVAARDAFLGSIK